MTGNFKLHPHLNPDMALAYAPSQIKTDELAVLPDDWFQALINLCVEYINDEDAAEQSEAKKALFRNKMNAKAGPSSTYRLKDQVIESLETIYRRLTGQFDSDIGNIQDDEITATVSKLQEGVGLCQDGFHARVQEITLGYKMPTTIAELLTVVRTNLVEQVANALSTSEQSVHQHNQVYIVAASEVGIGAKHGLDPHVVINLRDVSSILQKKFNEEYRPLNLPFLLSEAIRDVFVDFGYVGAKSGGYDDDGNIYYYEPEVRDVFQLYLHKIFNSLIGEPGTDERGALVRTKKLFIYDDNDQAIDINWRYIRWLILSALLNSGVIKQLMLDVDSLTTVRDCAQFADYYQKDPAKLIGKERDLVASASYQHKLGGFSRELIFVARQYPEYFQRVVDVVLSPVSKKAKECVVLAFIEQGLLQHLESLELDFSVFDQESFTKSLFKSIKNNQQAFVDFVDNYGAKLTEKIRKKLFIESCRLKQVNVAEHLASYMGELDDNELTALLLAKVDTDLSSFEQHFSLVASTLKQSTTNKLYIGLLERGLIDQALALDVDEDTIDRNSMIHVADLFLRRGLYDHAKSALTKVLIAPIKKSKIIGAYPMEFVLLNTIIATLHDTRSEEMFNMLIEGIVNKSSFSIYRESYFEKGYSYLPPNCLVDSFRSIVARDMQEVDRIFSMPGISNQFKKNLIDLFKLGVVQHGRYMRRKAVDLIAVGVPVLVTDSWPTILMTMYADTSFTALGMMFFAELCLAVLFAGMMIKLFGNGNYTEAGVHDVISNQLLGYSTCSGLILSCNILLGLGLNPHIIVPIAICLLAGVTGVIGDFKFGSAVGDLRALPALEADVLADLQLEAPGDQPPPALRRRERRAPLCCGIFFAAPRESDVVSRSGSRASARGLTS